MRGLTQACLGAGSAKLGGGWIAFFCARGILPCLHAISTVGSSLLSGSGRDPICFSTEFSYLRCCLAFGPSQFDLRRRNFVADMVRRCCA